MFAGGVQNARRSLVFTHPRQTPSSALYFCFGVAFVSAWLNSSPLVAFNAVSGLVSNGFVMVYGLPSLLRCTWGRKTFKSSPAFSLGRFSIPMAVLSAIYGAPALRTRITLWLTRNALSLQAPSRLLQSRCRLSIPSTRALSTVRNALAPSSSQHRLTRFPRRRAHLPGCCYFHGVPLPSPRARHHPSRMGLRGTEGPSCCSGGGSGDNRAGSGREDGVR